MTIEENPASPPAISTADTGAILARAFRASGTILIISTLSDGCLVEVNDAFERVLGYRRDDVLGRRSAQIGLWQSAKDREGYVRLLQEQGTVRDLEVRLRSASGTAVVGLISGEIIELGAQSCILSVLNDITDSKRAVEEIEVLHTNLAAHALALELANEELEAFSYTVSHDLRKPLTAISGYCQLLQESCAGARGAECENALDNIVAGTSRMSDLIDTLLEFSRLSQGAVDRQPVDLTFLATEAVAELEASEPRRKVAVHVQEGMVGEGDTGLLRVVMDNLIGNAWKFTAEREDAAIEIGSAVIEGKPAFFVRDNGIGLEPARAESLFTAFRRQRGSERFDGFGIGLATVKRIIKRHGGRVWAEGEPGRGATFYFTTG